MVTMTALNAGLVRKSLQTALSTQDRLTEDTDFWPFLQPVGLYNVLSIRQRRVLNRNLRYTLRSNLRPPPLGREIQVRLTGCDLLTAPDSRPVQSLSVVVAVAEALSNGIDFKPVDAKLAVWDPSNHSAAEAAASGRQPALRSAPTVTLKIPDAKALLPLHVVMMVWEGAPDLHTVLPKRHGASLATSLSQPCVLGLMPSGEAVWAASTPLIHPAPKASSQPAGKAASKSVTGKFSVGVAAQGQNARERDVLAVIGGYAPSPDGAHTMHLTRSTVTNQRHEVVVPGKLPDGLRTAYTMRLVAASREVKQVEDAEAAVRGPVSAGGSKEGLAAGAHTGVPYADTRKLMRPPVIDSITLAIDIAAESLQRAAALRGGDGNSVVVRGKRGRQELISDKEDGEDEAAAKKARNLVWEARTWAGNLGGEDSDGIASGDMSLSYCTRVHFRYMYDMDRKGVDEEGRGGEGCHCCFCNVVCPNSLLLKLHLMATHDHFHYEFLTPPESGSTPHERPAPRGSPSSNAALGVWQKLPPGTPACAVVLVRARTNIYTGDGRLMVPHGDCVTSADNKHTYRLLWFYHRRTNPHTILPIGGSPPQDFGGQGSPVGEDLPMFWKPASDVAASDEAGSDGGDNAQGGEGGRPRVASGTADAATAAGAGEVPRRCRVDGEPWATRGRHVLYGFGDGVGDLADTLYGRSFPEPRYYFHARTAVPMLAGDLDEGRDSDDEDIDEEWERMVRRDMHGTTYLTEAERALMVAWMRFERHPGNSYFSDYIMPDRCEAFVKERGDVLRALGPGARHALTVHLLLMHDYALIDGECVDRCLRMFDGEVVPELDRAQLRALADEEHEFGLPGVGASAAAAQLTRDAANYFN